MARIRNVLLMEKKFPVYKPSDHEFFIPLVASMLTLNPIKRITIELALQFDFFDSVKTTSLNNNISDIILTNDNDKFKQFSNLSSESNESNESSESSQFGEDSLIILQKYNLDELLMSEINQMRNTIVSELNISNDTIEIYNKLLDRYSQTVISSEFDANLSCLSLLSLACDYNEINIIDSTDFINISTI